MAFSNEVYAYGNVDGLVGILTAVKLIIGANEYQDLIRLGVIIGFIVVSIASLMPQHWAKGWKWLAQVAVLSGIAFIPKTDVTVIDRLGVQPAQVVQNVPWALGVLWSIKSNVGDTITSLFETGFQSIPTDAAMSSSLTYRDHGMMFGNKLIAQHLSSMWVSGDVETDVTNYIKNCFIPVVGKLVTEDDVLNSGVGLWGLMGNTNAALFTTYHKDVLPSGTVVTVADCKSAYTYLNTKVGADVTRQIAKLAPSFYPTLTVAMAQAAFGTDLVAAMTKAKLATAAATANDLILSSALRNSYGAANVANSVAAGDQAAMLQAYSKAQGTASMNAAFAAEGSYAEEALPIMRNITDGLLMGVFPLVVIFLLMSEGQMAKRLAVGYLLTAVWVELWPPMFAIVNFMATTSSARELAAAASSVGGLTLENATGIYSGSISATAMVGKYLNMVPFIAAAVVFGMDRLVSGGGLTRAPVDQAASSAGEAAKGNASGGNVSVDKRSMSTEESSPYMRKMDYTNGMVYSDLLNGDYRADVRTGSNPQSVDVTRDLSRRWTDQSALAQASANTLNSNFERSIDASFNDVQALSKGSGLQNTKVNGVAFQDMNSAGVTSSEVAQTTRNIAQKLGIDEKTAVEMGLTASVEAGLKPGGLVGAGLSMMGVSLQAKLAAAGRTTTAEQVTQALESGVNSLKQIGTQRKLDAVTSYMTSDDFKSARSSNREATQRVDAGLKEAVGAREGAHAKFEESKRFQSLAEKAMVVSTRWSTSNTIDLNNYLKQEGITPGAASYDQQKAEAAVLKWLQSSEVFLDDHNKPFLSSIGAQGPRAVATMPSGSSSYAPDARGESPLLQDYDRARGELAKQVPGKPTSAPAVQAANDANVARVRSAQSKQGLSPNDVVRDNKLSEEAKAAKARAEEQIAATQTSTEEQRQGTREKMDERQGNLNPLHLQDTSKLAQETPSNFGMGSGASRKIPGGQGPATGPSGLVDLIPGPTDEARKAAEAAQKAQQSGRK
ncbi:hypothetical protein JY96_21380 [Aquabacterium sp. NJ1]|uniref:conjugal transfer protein TraG N-terminal domain-containing protein n=1 Tax=Aquabacterium sp. NJ1 TaxID=1538295 RepID=UPI00052C3E63|nr:conjugal transfer protein TraG N-terminal domain-containing protein [Aquabacterium sp. NJ1]KGM38727.1 hypothetical protein JY96_21380 [Aquabacterium sp. NJ1]